MGTLGGVIMAVSEPMEAWEVLLVGRLVVGLCAGLNTVLVPTYVSEIAPVNLRGGLGVFNQLGIILGIFHCGVCCMHVFIFFQLLLLESFLGKSWVSVKF